MFPRKGWTGGTLPGLAHKGTGFLNLFMPGNKFSS